MSRAEPVVAVVVAGGMGSRMNSAVPKQFLLLKGKPVVQWSLECFDQTPEVDSIVLVLPEDRIEEGLGKLADFKPHKKFTIVAGGARRQDSVRAGVNAIDAEDGWVAVHDAARPGITNTIVSNAFKLAFELGNAVCAMPSYDTLVKAIDGEIVGQINRSEVYRVQTPQIFRVSVLRQALEYADKNGILATDEAGMVRELGCKIHLVEGSELNSKITRAEDLDMLKALL